MQKEIERDIEKAIIARLFKGKAVLIFGPRQVGKTTLVDRVVKKAGYPVKHINADEEDMRQALTRTTSTALRILFEGYKLICIDEAQRVEGIGVTIKLITDVLKDVQVIATGSSAFDLTNVLQEPLTGRKFEFQLNPLSFQEMANHHGVLEEQRWLEQRMIYGYYPEIINNPVDAVSNLKSISNSYLYKDLLSLDNINKPALLNKIVRALALQLGSEVSINEVAQLVNANYNTVEKYIDLLEKAFILFTLPAYSGNVRNEIKKGRKIYFYDNGIRNAVIGNYSPLNSRNDVGALWENYLLSERMKYLNVHGIDVYRHFWRTTQQQEIDYLEVTDQSVDAFEFKWSKTKKPKFSKTFTQAYPNASTKIVSTENYLEFIYSQTFDANL